MKRLHVYLFREVWVTSAVAVGLFVFVLLAGNAITDIAALVATGRLSLGVFLQLVGLLVPFVVSYAMPLGLLTGIMIALGRLSSNHEWTAMRAAGLSLYYLVAPVFLLALLGVGVSLVFNFQLNPLARTRYKEILGGVIRENPVNFLQPRTFIREFPGYVVYIGERKGTELRDFWLWELDEQKRVRQFGRAERARVEYRPEDATLILTLLDASGEQRLRSDPENFRELDNLTLYFREWSFRLSLDALFGRSTARRKLSMLTLDQLVEEWNLQRSLAAEVGAGGLTVERVRVQTQIQQHAAMAFSVFSLVLVAIPLALKAGRKETYTNFAMALGLALTFYFLMVLATWLEDHPEWRPDLLVWTPNLAFQGFGLWFLHRANHR